MAKRFIIEPQFRGDLRVGTEGDSTAVYVGRIAEVGPPRKVVFGGSKEFVSLIIGKRGSGKSHTLGAILEGMATTSSESSISQHKSRRAVLLLDPMGNFWTSTLLVRADGPPKVREQFASLAGWGCQPEPVNVTVWLPAGFRTANDAPYIKDFTIRVTDLDAADIADILGLNLIRDPQGAALAEAYAAVREDGWHDGNTLHRAKEQYSFDDLVEYLEHLKNAQQGGDHSTICLKTLIKSLRACARRPVFSGDGTPLTDLLRAGMLGILMLPHRVGSDLRRVIARILIRRILKDREEASQIRQRLDVESLAPETASRLEAELERRIPRTVLAIDEAQELLGDEGAEAKRALEAFCLLGRNYGLSLLLATQRPTTTAISAKVRSQVDLYFIHRLLTQDDIDLTYQNLLTVIPNQMRDGDQQLDFTRLVRSLEKGQAIVSGSNMAADEAITRFVVAQVRPRITVHGGEVG